jgi:hypothetical protein
MSIIMHFLLALLPVIFYIFFLLHHAYSWRVSVIAAGHCLYWLLTALQSIAGSGREDWPVAWVFAQAVIALLWLVPLSCWHLWETWCDWDFTH